MQVSDTDWAVTQKSQKSASFHAAAGISHGRKHRTIPYYSFGLVEQIKTSNRLEISIGSRGPWISSGCPCPQWGYASVCPRAAYSARDMGGVALLQGPWQRKDLVVGGVFDMAPFRILMPRFPRNPGRFKVINNWFSRPSNQFRSQDLRGWICLTKQAKQTETKHAWIWQ